MKNILFFLLLLTVTIIHGQNSMVFDANAIPRTIKDSFTNIEVSGGIDLYLSQSDQVAVAVSASENKFREKIQTVVTNGTLKIYYDGDKLWNVEKKKLKAYVSFKILHKLSASGASDIWVLGNIRSDDLLLDLSGASDFKGEVNVNSLQMELSGASDVKISGTAVAVNIESSGASDVKGYELVTETCTAKASGASDISITVNKELYADANGSSDISYKGNAVRKDMHSRGSSSIKKRYNKSNDN